MIAQLLLFGREDDAAERAGSHVVDPDTGAHVDVVPDEVDRLGFGGRRHQEQRRAEIGEPAGLDQAPFGQEPGDPRQVLWANGRVTPTIQMYEIAAATLGSMPVPDAGAPGDGAPAGVP